MRKKELGVLAVFFNSGVSHDQCPHLSGTIFLFKHAVPRMSPSEPGSRFDGESVEELLQYHYEGALDYFLWEAIGPFTRQHDFNDRIVGIPQQIVSKFFYGRPFDNKLDYSNPDLFRDLLFAKWQSQAEAWGWGPREAECLLRTLHAAQQREKLRKSLQDSIRASKQALERAWNAAVSSVKEERRDEPSQGAAKTKEQERERGR